MIIITPPRHPSRNIPYEDLSDKEEFNNTFYQEDDFEDEVYDGRTAYGRIPTGEADSLFLIMIGEEET